MIENDIICVRERNNVKCIYELVKGYYTNINFNYEKLVDNVSCLNYLVRYCKLFVKPSSKSILSPREFTLNEYEDQVIFQMSHALHMSIDSLTYNKHQTGIIGNFSSSIFYQLNRVIDYLDNIIVLFGPEKLYLLKQTQNAEKLSILFTPEDLKQLSRNERWSVVNAK